MQRDRNVSGTGNLQPEVFGQTLTNFLGQVIVHVAGADHGDVDHGGWGGRSDGNRQPDQGRQGEASEGGDLKPEGVARAEVANDAEGEQEYGRRKRGQHDQGDVDGAVQALASMAAGAIAEVFLVIAAHLRRQARNVITPPGEDLANDRVDTLLTHFEELQSNRVHGCGL